MTLRPAGSDTGIVFLRKDLESSGKSGGVSKDRLRLPAAVDYVQDSYLGTTLSNEFDISVATVEHLLAALSGCGVDNAVVELDGCEVPIMDGSAAFFVTLIDAAGIVEQPAFRRMMKIVEPVSVADGYRFCELRPGEGFAIDVTIDFDTPVISRQRYRRNMAPSIFRHEISRARTFGFLEDIEKLHANGRALGASLDNALVISGDQIVNREALRYEDEFVRHKVLDAIGDLYLIGAPIEGHFHSYCAGHEMHHRLLRELLARPRVWSLVAGEEDISRERVAYFNSGHVAVV